MSACLQGCTPSQRGTDQRKSPAAALSDPWDGLRRFLLQQQQSDSSEKLDPKSGDEGMARSLEGLTAPAQSCDAVLCDAVAKNNVQLVRELLRAGHTPNCRDEDGKSPLHIAAELGHSLLVKMLVWAGADVEARAGDMDATPLLVAAANGQTGTTLALLELGADANAIGASSTTALSIATRNNDVRLMLSLIKHGAIVDSRSASGWTPLHVAAGLDHPAAISVLVKHGANTNNIDEDGDTPLITACSLDHIDCVQQLLEGGADPRVTSKRGDSALHIACELGLEEIASILIAQGAPLHTRTAEGRTARWLALSGGHLDIVKMIDQALCRVTSV